MPQTEWTLRARRDGRVLVIEARGVATLVSLRTLRGFVVAAVEAHGDLAVVVDLRGVQARLNPEDWRQAAHDSARSGFKAPVGIVVDPMYFDATVQHCFAVVEHGLRRMAFTDLDLAISWAQTLVSRAASSATRTGPSPSTPPSRLWLVHSG